MLLIYLSGFTPCFPSYDLIQQELGIYRNGIAKTVKSLVAKGMISVKKGSKKSGKANEYILHLDVMPPDPTPSKPEHSSDSISSNGALTNPISSNGALINPISSNGALINDGLKSNINDLEVLLVQNKHSNNTNIYNCTNTAKHKEENIIPDISNTNTTVETSLDSISMKSELTTDVKSMKIILTNPISMKSILINDGLKSNTDDLEALKVSNSYSNNTNSNNTVSNTANTVINKTEESSLLGSDSISEENVIPDISNTNTTVETSLLVQSPLAEETNPKQEYLHSYPPRSAPPPQTFNHRHRNHP